MNEVSIKSYVISNLNYDILSMDADEKGFKGETSVRLAISKKDNNDNKMQIDFKGYTDKNNPFIEVSIAGCFELPKEILNENTETVADVLKENGFPLLYGELKKCCHNIFKISNVTLPDLPDIENNN